MANEPTNPIETLREKVKDIKIAMFTTQEQDGTLRSRPMGTQDITQQGILYFFTRASSAKVNEVQTQQQVNVSYAKPNDQLYVSVSGTATLLRDRSKMQELWNPIFKAWFPDGLEDPDLALLQVEVDSAEYWDSPSSKVVQLVGFAKAVITGKSADGLGENVKLDIAP